MVEASHEGRASAVPFQLRPRCRRSPLDLISLHVPKAFGTSLRQVLVRHYGRRRVATDYTTFLEDDRAIEDRAPALPRNAAVVHGHFPATRYAAVPARRRVAFLRDPVRRTISHYFFWLNEPRHGNPLHDRMLDEKLDVIAFARLPQIRWFYSHTVFGGIDPASFDLIGVVERLDRDWRRFQDLTGIAAPLPHLNRNRYPGYGEAVEQVTEDRVRMEALQCLLDDDIRFYRRFL